MAEQAVPASVHERLQDFLEAADPQEAPASTKETLEAETTEEATEELTEAPDGPDPEEGEAAEGEAAKGKAAEAEEEEEEEVAITSFQELAEHEGIDLDTLYSLTVKVNSADGTPKEVPLGEWKDSYQASELVKAERDKLIERQAAFETEAAKKFEAIDATYYTASKIVENAEKQLVGEYDQARLQELRVTDPAEYAAISQEYRERTEQIQQWKQSLGQEYQQLRDKQGEEMKAKQLESLQIAHKSLPKYVPEWSDENLATKEKPQIIQYGLNKGFTEQEMSQVMDPRYVAVLRDAMLYNAQKTAVPKSKKVIKTLGGKVIGSGKSKTKTQRKSQSVQQDYGKFRKTGEVRDAAEYIEKHLLGEF